MRWSNHPAQCRVSRVLPKELAAFGRSFDEMSLHKYVLYSTDLPVDLATSSRHVYVGMAADRANAEPATGKL